jgi:NADH-quinone oxidoreductase subunit B
MRIQDKIKGHKIAKRKAADGSSKFMAKGVKVEDELPVPHHSGFVEAPADQDPLFDHQKITG